MEDMRSPLDKAIAARNSPPKKPYPDLMRRHERNVPKCPLDIDAASIKGDGPALDRAREAMSAIRSSWDAIRDAARETEDVRKLAKDAGQLASRATRAADKATEYLANAEDNLREQIRERVEVSVNPALATEIRQAARGRDDLVTMVMNDRRVASAILSAPAFLSGIDNRRQATLREAAEGAHAGEQVARLRQVRRAAEQIDAAGRRVNSELMTRVRDWDKAEPSAVVRMREMANAH